MGKPLIHEQMNWVGRAPGEVRPEQERTEEAVAKKRESRLAAFVAIALIVAFVGFGCSINIIFPQNSVQQREHDRLVHLFNLK
jgi:hypothetical protein